MTLKEYLKKIEKFVREYLENSHQDCYVLGLSGGVDSSLVAAISKNAVGKDKLLCVNITIDSHPSDLLDAREVAKELDLNLIEFDASEIYHKQLEEFNRLGISLDRATTSNLKVRIRMCTLYAFAQNRRGLVIGTDNADERYTGYFTKYGDGGVDLLPISKLLKREVVEACKIYGLSNRLAERTPSAGLFEGQTDESEMRIRYEDLDNYLLGKKVSEEATNRIEYLHKISEHKRIPIPEMEDFDRS